MVDKKGVYIIATITKDSKIEDNKRIISMCIKQALCRTAKLNESKSIELEFIKSDYEENIMGKRQLAIVKQIPFERIEHCLLNQLLDIIDDITFDSEYDKFFNFNYIDSLIIKFVNRREED